MKLKQALKIAKDKGFDFIVVEVNKNIYMCKREKLLLCPDTNCETWLNENSQRAVLRFELIGIYTGSKNWKDTLREVK